MSMDFVPTRSSSKKAETLNNFQIITHQSYKSKKSAVTVNNDTAKQAQSNEFNIKKAKYEIIKFGMSGFDPQKKEEAKIQLAIKLGAKPPKNKYKNYRVLIEERKKQKQEQKSKTQFQQLGKNSVGKSTAKKKGFEQKKRKKTSKGILDVYGKVKVSK